MLTCFVAIMATLGELLELITSGAKNPRLASFMFSFSPSPHRFFILSTGNVLHQLPGQDVLSHAGFLAPAAAKSIL